MFLMYLQNNSLQQYQLRIIYFTFEFDMSILFQKLEEVNPSKSRPPDSSTVTTSSKAWTLTKTASISVAKQTKPSPWCSTSPVPRPPSNTSSAIMMQHYRPSMQSSNETPITFWAYSDAARSTKKYHLTNPQKNKLKRALKDLETIYVFSPDNLQISAFKTEIEHLLLKQGEKDISSDSDDDAEDDEESQLNFCKLKLIDRKSIDRSCMKERKSRVTILGDTTFEYKI